nr:hypothetical protein [Candidatus Woesebacteria bacterium]
MDGIFAEVLSGLLLTVILFLSLVITLVFGAGLFYGFVLLSRMRKREKQSMSMVTIEIRVPKDNEIKIDSAEQFFASLAGLKTAKGFTEMMNVSDCVAFEMVGVKGKVGFYITMPEKIRDLVEKQIYAFYPVCDIEIVDEPNIFTEDGKVAYAAMKLKKEDYEPLKVYRDLPTDSLSIVTSPLSKMGDDEAAII